MYENGALGKEMIKELLGYVRIKSLNSAYSGIKDYLFDFYSSLSWDSEGRIEDLDEILKSKEFPKIQKFFMSIYKFDFKKELLEAREMAEDDLTEQAAEDAEKKKVGV